MALTWLYRYFLLPVLTVCAFTLYQRSTDLPGQHFFKRSESRIQNAALAVRSLQSVKFTKSAGGLADCVEGIIPVNASATNRVVNFPPPANNTDAAQLIRNIFAPNGNFGATIDGGPKNVSGTYNIFSRLCVPHGKSGSQISSTLHFLTHGGTLDHTYYDFAPGYSYVDQAASRGYATFSYDRLGTGLSQHPDGIQITQLPLQVAIAHQLVSILRSGSMYNVSVSHVVGVGHSLGSALTQNVVSLYPQDFDVLALTGYSAFPGGAALGVFSTAQQIANTLPNSQFRGLDNGYVAPAPVYQAGTLAFYQSPFFDQSIFMKQFSTRQTNALGETVTLGAAFAPAGSFTGPVAIIDGQQDFFFCGGDCTSPPNLLAQAIGFFFPAASNTSTTAVVPNAGHNLFLHLSATQAVNKVLDFIDANCH